ncbi:MAG: nuclear transport factor 2 family protein [Betaproteobacteria bacterium]|nr:nuclear transport factor 2 family protein [Betaproteobacteria bacterium]
MSDQTVIADIETLEVQRRNALVNKDFASLANLLGEDLLYVHSSAVAEDKALYLKKLTDGLYDYSALKSLRRSHRVLGDIVLVDGDLEIHVRVSGADKVVNSRYLQVWARRAGGWKMVSWQSTPIPQG